MDRPLSGSARKRNSFMGQATLLSIQKRPNTFEQTCSIRHFAFFPCSRGGADIPFRGTSGCDAKRRTTAYRPGAKLGPVRGGLGQCALFQPRLRAPLPTHTRREKFVRIASVGSCGSPRRLNEPSGRCAPRFGPNPCLQAFANPAANQVDSGDWSPSAVERACPSDDTYAPGVGAKESPPLPPLPRSRDKRASNRSRCLRPFSLHRYAARVGSAFWGWAK